MRLGLAIPHYDTSLEGRRASWTGVLDVARRAEASGFDSVWISDHLFLDWSKYGDSDAVQGSLEAWTTMSALAAATERIRIGSLTLCNDFRNPALLAKMAASLDLLSGGRLELGLGAGWYEREYQAAGIAFDRATARIERLGEAVQIIALLLDGEEVVFKGNHYTIDGAICRPRPLQQPRPPIWIGGKGDRLLATAARYADGWNFSWIGSIDAYRDRLAVFEQAAEAVGRDPSSIRRSVGAYLLVGRDDRDLQARFDAVVERSPAGVLPPQSPASRVSWASFKSRGIAGTVNQVIEQLGALKELRVEEVIVTLGAIPFQLADEQDVDFVGRELAGALT